MSIGHIEQENLLSGVVYLRKRFYIMLVARNAEGDLLKIPVPMHYLYVFVAGARSATTSSVTNRRL